MAEGNRSWSVPQKRVVASVILTVVAIFLVCGSIGAANWLVGAVGLALLAAGAAIYIVSALDNRVFSFIPGEGHVVSVSPPPPSATRGRCNIHLIVSAKDIKEIAIKIRDPDVLVSKWPDPGTDLPILVAVNDPRRVRVLWDEVQRHGTPSRVGAGVSSGGAGGGASRGSRGTGGSGARRSGGTGGGSGSAPAGDDFDVAAYESGDYEGAADPGTETGSMPEAFGPAFDLTNDDTSGAFSGEEAGAFPGDEPDDFPAEDPTVEVAAFESPAAETLASDASDAGTVVPEAMTAEAAAFDGPAFGASGTGFASAGSVDDDVAAGFADPGTIGGGTGFADAGPMWSSAPDDPAEAESQVFAASTYISSAAADEDEAYFGDPDEGFGTETTDPNPGRDVIELDVTRFYWGPPRDESGSAAGPVNGTHIPAPRSASGRPSPRPRPTPAPEPPDAAGDTSEPDPEPGPADADPAAGSSRNAGTAWGDGPAWQAGPVPQQPTGADADAESVTSVSFADPASGPAAIAMPSGTATPPAPPAGPDTPPARSGPSGSHTGAGGPSAPKPPRSRPGRAVSPVPQVITARILAVPVVLGPDGADAPFDQNASGTGPATTAPSGTGRAVSAVHFVTDLTRSVEFYRDLLGFQEVETAAGRVVMRAGDAWLELHLSDTPRPLTPAVSLQIDVTDADAAYAHMLTHGAEFVNGPRQTRQYGQRESLSAPFRDPDGYLAVITQWLPGRAA